MSTTINLNASNLRDILRYIHTAVVFYLQSKPTETFSWYDKWVQWDASDLAQCNTIRAVATIIYGTYDRKQHDCSHVLETIRDKIPILDDYFDFNKIT